jgi:hypothetical protein
MRWSGPEPTRLRRVLSGDADPGAVRQLLVREQGCCAFLSFTITAEDGRLVVDLEVPTEAAPTLDALAMLGEAGQLIRPGLARPVFSWHASLPRSWFGGRQDATARSLAPCCLPRPRPSPANPRVPAASSNPPPR